MSLLVRIVCSMVACALVATVVAARGDCTANEFEAPHREWSAACVAQFLTNIGLAEHHSEHFESMGVLGRDLRRLNETVLMKAAPEGHNVTNEADRAKIIDGIKRLEQHDPSDSTDSGLYLPLMLAGCMCFIYIMFIKDTPLERQCQTWVRKMSKKVKSSNEASRAGGAAHSSIEQDDWLVGTSAAGASGTKKRAGKKSSNK